MAEAERLHFAGLAPLGLALRGLPLRTKPDAPMRHGLIPSFQRCRRLFSLRLCPFLLVLAGPQKSNLVEMSMLNLTTNVSESDQTLATMNAARPTAVPAPRGPEQQRALALLQANWARIPRAADGLSSGELRAAMLVPPLGSLPPPDKAVLQKFVNYFTQGPGRWNAYTGPTSPGILTLAEVRAKLPAPQPQAPGTGDYIWALNQLLPHWVRLAGNSVGLTAAQLKAAVQPGSPFQKFLDNLAPKGPRTAKLRGIVDYWITQWPKFAGSDARISKAELTAKLAHAQPPITVSMPAGYTMQYRAITPGQVPSGPFLPLTNQTKLTKGGRYQFVTKLPDGKIWDTLQLGPWGWGEMPSSLGPQLTVGNTTTGKGQWILTRTGNLAYITNGPGADPLRFGIQVSGFPANSRLTFSAGEPRTQQKLSIKVDGRGRLVDNDFGFQFKRWLGTRQEFKITVDNGDQSFVLAFNRNGNLHNWTQAKLSVSGGNAVFRPIAGKEDGFSLQLTPTRSGSLEVEGAPATAQTLMAVALAQYQKFRVTVGSLGTKVNQSPGGAFATTGQHAAKTAEWISEIQGLAAELAEDQMRAARSLTQLAVVDGTGVQLTALTARLSDKNADEIKPVDAAQLLSDLYSEPQRLMTAATNSLRTAATEVKGIRKAEEKAKAAQDLSMALGIVGAVFGLAFGAAMFVKSVGENAVRGAKTAQNMATWRDIWRDGGVLFRKNGWRDITRGQAWGQGSWGLLDGFALVSQAFDRTSYFLFLENQSKTTVTPGPTSPARQILAILEKMPPEAREKWIKNLTTLNPTPDDAPQLDSFTDAVREYTLTNNVASRVAMEKTPSWFGSVPQSQRPAALKKWYDERKAAITAQWDTLYTQHPWLKTLFEVKISEPKKVEGTVHYYFEVHTLAPK